MKWDGSDTARVPVISTVAEKQGKLDPKKGRERRKETMEGGRKEGMNELVSTHTVKF